MTDAFAAAAEPTRRRILQLLARRPQIVTDLASHFDVTRSAISQHLGVLAEAGLVSAQQRGRERLYRVEQDGVRRLQREIESFWTAELDHLAADARRLVESRATSTST